MQQEAELRQIPDLPINQDGPVFDEPWQLTAFGIVVMLHRNGHFAWHEWVAYLSAEIERGNIYDVTDINGIYYRQWLAALEKIVAAKNLTNFEDLVARKEEWRHADEHRGFGQPLMLHGGEDGHHHHHHHHDHHLHDGDAGHADDPHLCRQPAARHIPAGRDHAGHDHAGRDHVGHDHGHQH